MQRGEGGAKRAFDVLVASTSLLVLSPLLLLAGLAIKLESRGPVLFRQERVGLHGKPFYIYKLRSMVAEQHGKGPQITDANDLRITRVGRLLRAIKLDEMPQLLNVLRGEMSLVGPRPEVPCYVAHYSDEQRQVLNVRPGMADPATIYFRHEETLLAGVKDRERYYVERILPRKLMLNRHYIERMSLGYDLKLIMLEACAIVLPRRWFERIIVRALENDGVNDLKEGSQS